MKGIKALKHLEVNALFYGLLDTSHKAIIVAAMDGTIVFLIKKLRRFLVIPMKILKGKAF